MPINIILIDGTKGIAGDAFSDYFSSSPISITIPDSVISIDSYAFNNCRSLTIINVSNGNTNYSAQDGVLYNKNKTKLIRYPEGKKGTIFTIPSSVNSIGDNAFKDCASLTSVNVPDGVTSIGDGAFSCCKNLTSIKIPDSVTSIGMYAFFDSGVKNLNIPKNIEKIGFGAFADTELRKTLDITVKNKFGDVIFATER